MFDNWSNGHLIYNASKGLAKYLKALSKNEFAISDTLTLPDLIKSLTNSGKYEDVSYDVESFFTSIPVEETINNIIAEFMFKKKSNHCAKSLFFKKTFA